jgi:hypothetical protein
MFSNGGSWPAMDEFVGLLGLGMGSMVASAGKRYVVFLTKPAGKGGAWLLDVAEVERSLGLAKA